MDCFWRMARKALVQICGDEHAVIRSNAEQRQKSDPNRHAQINGVDLKELPQIDAKECGVEKPGLPVEPEV